MKTVLNQSEKEWLELKHRTEKNSKIADRIKTVLLSSEGWSYKQISQALRIHQSTVVEHINDYVNSKKLEGESGGSVSHLTKEQTDELIVHLEENTYPTTNEIIAYVFSTYGKMYSQQGMHNWSKKHKFSFKKPKGIPLKYDKEKQKAFIKKYMSVLENLIEGEEIFFMDSVHPTQETKITSGWIKKGVDKMIATVAGRRRINMTGAVNPRDMSVFAKEYETINAEATIDFLKYLDESTPNTKLIHLAADGGRAHTCIETGAFLGIKDPFNRKYLLDAHNIKLPSPKVAITKNLKRKLKAVMHENPKLFVDKHILEKNSLTVQILLDTLSSPPTHSKFILHVLPAYSPNLNPIERVWKLMNEYCRNNVVFETFKSFKNAVFRFFGETWKTIPIDELKSRINDNFEQLKPVN